MWWSHWFHWWLHVEIFYGNEPSEMNQVLRYWTAILTYKTQHKHIFGVLARWCKSENRSVYCRHTFQNHFCMISLCNRIQRIEDEVDEKKGQERMCINFCENCVCGWLISQLLFLIIYFQANIMYYKSMKVRWITWTRLNWWTFYWSRTKV